MPIDTNHAYTHDVHKTKQNRQREFSEERAVMMGKIFEVIQSPKSKLIHQGHEILFDYVMSGRVYTVFLLWNAIKKQYEFQSAHFRDEKWLSAVRTANKSEQQRYANFGKTPLTKKRK
ncbi:MAG: hypothetical protein Q4G13_02165 [Moraxella sp.]|nr:hypothetical protein [Moraxella sp.]